ncbi:hypothetical protein B0H11DRAFT_1213545 [Mycena galericulata]|nr:hypothetical protein B0H11DRAFT_1213545 [Mycena galericulata]
MNLCAQLPSLPVCLPFARLVSAALISRRWSSRSSRSPAVRNSQLHRTSCDDHIARSIINCKLPTVISRSLLYTSFVQVSSGHVKTQKTDLLIFSRINQDGEMLLGPKMATSPTSTSPLPFTAFSRSVDRSSLWHRRSTRP